MFSVCILQTNTCNLAAQDLQVRVYSNKTKNYACFISSLYVPEDVQVCVSFLWQLYIFLVLFNFFTILLLYFCIC